MSDSSFSLEFLNNLLEIESLAKEAPDVSWRDPDALAFYNLCKNSLRPLIGQFKVLKTLYNGSTNQLQNLMQIQQDRDDLLLKAMLHMKDIDNSSEYAFYDWLQERDKLIRQFNRLYEYRVIDT